MNIKFIGIIVFLTTLMSCSFQPAYSSQLDNVVQTETCASQAYAYVVINTYFKQMDEQDFLKIMDLMNLSIEDQGVVFNNLKIMQEQDLTDQEIYHKMFTTCMYGFTI